MTELDIIKSFGKKRVLLIGDTILDVYIYGKEVCKALDVPVPEAEETGSSVSFGGAGLVTNNILALGGRVDFFSVVGADDDAQYYDNFTHPKLKKIFLVDKTRKTTVKRRWFIDGKKLLQVNKVDNHYINSGLERKLLKLLEPLAAKTDLIAVFDGQHGLMTKTLIGRLAELSKKYERPLYVDSQVAHKSSNHHWYKGADCLFLNQGEAMAANANFDIKKPEYSLRETQKKLGVANLVVKLGERGSVALFNDKYINAKPYPVKTVDVCGAGDAFLAAFCLGRREAPAETLNICNAWGGLATAVHGTLPPNKKDLINMMKNYER